MIQVTCTWDSSPTSHDNSACEAMWVWKAQRCTVQPQYTGLRTFSPTCGRGATASISVSDQEVGCWAVKVCANTTALTVARIRDSQAHKHRTRTTFTLEGGERTAKGYATTRDLKARQSQDEPDEVEYPAIRFASPQSNNRTRKQHNVGSVSYTHLTLPTTPYV